MIKRKVDKFWFPWWPEKWLWGTIRIECTPAERGIWVDLLSLASKDDGHIRANEETPYPLRQLAGMLIIPEKELEAAINKFVKMGKLTKTKTETLYVTKWDKYQFGDRHRRRVEEGMEPYEDDLFNKTLTRCPSGFSDMANKSGFIKMNRIVVAIAIGRSLKKEEEVHHVDKKENNNNPENLMLFSSHSDHGKYEYGHDINPSWDGSKLSIAEISATKAKIKATILNKNTLNNIKLNNNKEENTKVPPSPSKKNINPKIEFNFEKRIFLNITIEDKVGWKDAYPAVDIEHELKGMREWLLANPSKRKSNYRKFITNWLSRQQDKGGTKLNYEEKRKKGLDDWVKKPVEE